MVAGPRTWTRRGPDVLPWKRVGGVRHLHALDRIAEAERIAGLDRHDWNVVKLGDREKKVSLLNYAAFLENLSLRSSRLGPLISTSGRPKTHLRGEYPLQPTSKGAVTAGKSSPASAI